MSETRVLLPLAVDAAALALADEVQADLEGWAERWPIFDRVRFPAVALTTAVHLPGLTRPARALAALVSLWIIAFDEVVDEERVSDDKVGRYVAAFRAIVAHDARSVQAVSDDARSAPAAGAASDSAHAAVPAQTIDDDDALCTALRAIVAGMNDCATFPAFAAEWRRSFLRMIDATVEQHRLGRPRPDGASATAWQVLHSYDAMLALTTESISVRWYLLTGFVLSNDATLAQHADALLPIADSCARAIRLANDLRSWERDLAEGNANTLTALEAELAVANPRLTAAARRAQALQLLQGRLTAALAAAARLLAASPLAGSPALAGVERLLMFITGVYARSEFVAFSPSAVVPRLQ